MTKRRALPSLALLITALLAFAAAAHASTTQETIVQDDRLLLNFGTGTQNGALNELDTLGVTTVHAVINWDRLAPKPSSKTVPKGFKGRDPESYNQARWAVIDSLVRQTSSRGMDLLLSPAGPGPLWANGKCTTAERRRAPRGGCRTNASRYRDFVTALAKRYNGKYVPPGAPGALPKVTRWSLWNEPNLASWLYPSLVRGVPVAAKYYRALVLAGAGALRANGHARDQILLGETAPLGSRSSAAPVPFYEALFCVIDRGRRLRGRAAKAVGCPKRLKRLPVTGIAHHPYTRGAFQPLTARQPAGNVTISQLSRLRRVLKLATHARAISSSTAGHIYVTEFGVSSRPPAKPRLYGVPLSRQAEWLNEAEYLAWRNPAVRSIAQFPIEDDSFAARSSSHKLTFQSGLRFTATKGQLMSGQLGKPKPARAAFRVPLFVVDRGKKVLVWGGVRSASSGKVRVTVGGKTVKTVSLRHGYFSTTVRKRKGHWQLRFGSLRSRAASPVKLG
jgi:hypothetical protein